MDLRISSTFSVLGPFSYPGPFLYFETTLLQLAHFELCTSTFCQIWISYWSRSTGRRLRLEVKFRSKSSLRRTKVGGSKYRKDRRYENGRSAEKVELMRFCTSTKILSLVPKFRWKYRHSRADAYPALLYNIYIFGGTVKNEELHIHLCVIMYSNIGRNRLHGQKNFAIH